MAETPILDLHPGDGSGPASSDFQRALSARAAFDIGYRGAIIKASQGIGQFRVFDLDGYYARFDRVFNNMGLYHFLDGTASGAEQANYFVSQMKRATGRTDGRGIAIVVDFENYAVPPTNRHLREFIRELRKDVSRHPIGVYSNYSFWNEPPASGRIADFDADYVYDSRYPYPPVVQRPIATMRDTLGWYRDQPKWGGEPPAIWQGTGGGLVDGVVCDTNLLFVPFDNLV
jgi:GH25 family lysozyme M1 (1,4-beta-N-acetylmuramidase)